MLPRKSCSALLALGIALVAPAAYAQESVPSRLQVTDQKSAITILQPAPHPLYDLFTDKFVELGRFDYFPLSYRNDTKQESIADLSTKFQKYLNDNAAALAAKGKKPDLDFGGVVLTGEKLDKLLSSAYIMAPNWRFSPISLSDPKSVTDADGMETITVEAKSTLTLENEVVNVQTGKVIGKQSQIWPVSRKIELKAHSNESAAKRKVKQQIFDAEIKAATGADPMNYFKKNELAASTEIIMASVLSDVRKLDAFVLRSKLVEDNGSLKMLLGSNMGVTHDSTYNVYRNENGQMVNVGFLKVRDIQDGDSSIQGIRNLGYEPDDQLIEHPRTGFDSGLKLGMTTFDPKGGSALAPALMLTAERNLAQQFKNSALSETYLTTDLNFMLPMQEDMSKLLVGAQGLVGVKKRFYLNQVVLSAGLKGGVTASNGTVAQTRNVSNNAGSPISDDSNIDVIGAGFGAGPAVGLEYQFNPDLKIGLDLGFLFFTPVNPVKVSVTDRVTKDVSEFDVSQLRADLLPEALSATGVSFALTGSYSF
jgi:hypothetical protein